MCCKMEKKSWEGLIQKLIQRGYLVSPNIIKALRLVPRRLFLPEEVKSSAAVDCPLPIGSGQTISAPLSCHGAVNWAKHDSYNE